jgi:hypothetical protein
MGRSSAGGTRTAGGVGHEGRCLAWAAAYMLTEEPLPRWASGRRVAGVGGQTNRPVDDVGLVTDEGGWVTIQAKKGMRVDTRPGGGLGEAVRQLVEIDEAGVPEGPSGILRPLEPGRDLVLILSDDSAAQTVNRNLAPVVSRLRDLLPDVPVTEAAPNHDQAGALGALTAQLERCWKERWARDLSDADFRRLTSVVSVRALRIAEDGEDYATTVRVMLRDLAGDATNAETLWKALLTEGQRLAEERAYLGRDGLVKILDAQGIVLRPVARLRSDIETLRALSRVNTGLLGEEASITAPDGPVRLTRSVEAALLGAAGNVAVTGVPGSGKTVLLHALTGAAQATHDLAVLRAEDLRSSKAATRAELNLRHDLAEVLAGWTGRRPGLLLIDGVDQARGPEAPDWLPSLAAELRGTRWQVVATIRSFDLRNSSRWKGMFRGTPVATAAADPELAGVRHLLVGDLAGEELDVLRAASPRLAGLLDEASPRLRELLANPFNLDLAGQLLADGDASILQVHTRAELLAEYWRRRVGQGPAAWARTRTLRALVRQMLAGGRQAVSSLDLPAEATGEALTDLHRSGVLRQAPARPGRIDAPTGFAHPVLFDYAVAMLALGDLGQPGSLADVLDEDPNLAMTVRPSLEYRLGDAWAADPSRRDFWGLGLRLASNDSGHPLAAGECARVAAMQVDDIADLAMLAAAATGADTDPAGRWGCGEARLLAFLLAAAAERNRRREAMSCIDALTCDLARQARAADDVDLAVAAAQLPVCAEGPRNTAAGTPGYPWTAAAAADCMTVALKDLDDQRRIMLADPAARLLALAAATDPAAVAPVVAAVIDPGALHAWGMKAIRHLTRVLPAVARKDPGLAVAVGTAPWQYEETRRTPTPMTGSAILELSGNLQQDVDGERYMAGTRFTEVMQADPVAATTLLLAILQLPRINRFPAADWREPPAVGQGAPLMFAGGHQVLTTMVDAFAQGMQDLAEAGGPAGPGAGQAVTVLDQIVGRLVGELHHGETWKRLLARSAAAPSAALARALLPALSTATLYAHHETWNEAAHAACRAVTLLTAEELSQVRDAIRRTPDARTTPVTQTHAEALEQRADMILAALQEAVSGVGYSSADARSPESIPPGGLPLLQAEPDMPFRGEWSREDTVPGSFDDLAHRIREQLQEPAHTPQGDAAACRNLTALWDGLDKLTAGGKGGQAEALDLAAEIADRIAACPDTAPGGPLGHRIIATFLAALPDPGSLQSSAESRNADQSSWGSRLTPGWAVTAATRSAQALVRLYLDDSWRAARGREIRAALASLSDGPDPMYRLIASDALPALAGEQDAQIAELERRLFLEEDRQVATRLIYILGRYVNRDPRRIDDVLNGLAAAPRWAVLSASPAGEQPVGPTDRGSIGVGIIAALGGVYGTPFAREVLDAWLMAPADHPQRARAALHNLSYLLNPADPAGWPAQERLLDVTGKGLAQVQAAFDDAMKAHGTPGQQQARASEAGKYADHLALLIYAESGAMDDKRQQPAQQQRGDLKRYALLVMPLLEELSEIHWPSITHHVVQTADQIAPASPKKALLLAVKAVTGDEAYWREPAGAETVLGFVRRFAADHRAVFLGDREAVEAVRRLLESFIRLGWHQAIELAEELDELFN